MKMLNNGLEADGFATSCVARPPARPTQVHQDPHVEDGGVAVAVAEHVAVVEPVDEVTVLRKQKKGIKTVVSLPPS